MEIEIEEVWHLKTIIELVKLGALGMIPKGTDKHSNKIPVSPSLYEIQKKNAFCGTAQLLLYKCN